METPACSPVPNAAMNQTPLPSTAVGFILLNNGSLFSFGLLPPSVEARAAPGPDEWNEIKICPPFTVLALPPTKMAVCPADFCNDKVKSYESHARKHLSLILAEQRKTTRLNGNCDFPSSLKFGYYCNDGDCYAGLLMLDQSRGFNRMKYLRQHYLKVHAPRTFACSNCSKCFASLGLLGGHIKNCGNSFECSTCQKQYNTLEALQTHCRRHNHSTDYSKYKDFIENAKNEISSIRKAEKDLKQKGKPEPLPVQVIVPRPKTITCGPGGTPSHVIWTYDCGIDTPMVKSETCTQTETEIKPLDLFSSSKPNNPTSRIIRRKRSAETQTGKMKLKVSTEAQTLNVTKRRRTSKKQIAVEAETQCSSAPAMSSRSDSDEISTPDSNFMDSGVIFLPPSETPASPDELYGSSNRGGIISLPALMAMVGIVGDSIEIVPDHEHEFMDITTNNDTIPITSAPSAIVNVLDQQFEVGVNGYTTSPSAPTSEVCVGFDEAFDLEDYLRFELTRETQTDSSLLGLNIPEPDLTSLVNNFVAVSAAETQTSFFGTEPEDNPSSRNMNILPIRYPERYAPSNIYDEDYSRRFEDSFIKLTQDLNAHNSPTYLETIDGETQTSFPANGELFQTTNNMFLSLFNDSTARSITDEESASREPHLRF